MQWKNGKLQVAEIRSDHAFKPKVRYGAKTVEYSFKSGETLRLNAELQQTN